MALLKLENVSKSYGSGAGRTEVLDNISLEVEEGEFVAIVGYSGVGKTTLMSLIAGLIEADSGVIFMNGQVVNGTDYQRGLVFQNYSLLPWLTVEENVRLSVDQVYSREGETEKRERVARALAMVNLSPAAGKKPSELSGGMRQRTSVARTLAMRPKVLLLDEPLSALDALTRSVIQDEILNIWGAEKQTIILITNDVDEGLYMADRIIPLSMGPNATFGPEVKVDLPRPRDRAAMNHNETYRQLRHQVISYLLEQKQGATGENSEIQMQPPAMKPRDLSSKGKKGFMGFGQLMFSGATS